MKVLTLLLFACGKDNGPSTNAGYSDDIGGASGTETNAENGTEDTSGDCTSPTIWYEDIDGDGYGVDDPTTNIEACDRPYRMVHLAGDCDDRASNVHPSAPEVCDGRDNDCDDVIDDTENPSLGAIPWYIDEDGDGYGLDGTGAYACDASDDRAGRAGDCDDTLEEVNPGMDDVADGIDNNCDGLIDRDGILSGVMVHDIAESAASPDELDCSGVWQIDGAVSMPCPDCDFAFNITPTLDEASSHGDLAMCALSPLWTIELRPTFAIGFSGMEDSLTVSYGFDVVSWAYDIWDDYGYYYSYYGIYSAAGLADHWLTYYPTGFYWADVGWDVESWGDWSGLVIGGSRDSRASGSYHTDHWTLEFAIE